LLSTRVRGNCRLALSGSDNGGSLAAYPQNEVLGGVDDLVISLETGKITYLVIARGGIFGIDQKYFSVPWEDFKITPNDQQDRLGRGPQVNHDRFAADGNFDQESQNVDAYWKSKLSN